MGFFKSITKAISQPLKTVKSVVNTVIQNPVRATLAVSTLGGSEIARNIPVVGTYVQQGTQAASQVYKTAANVATGGFYGGVTGIASHITAPKLEDPHMAINIGGVLGQVGNIFSGGQNPYFNTVGQVANLASSFIAQPVAMRLPAPSSAAPIGAMTRAVTVGRGFFNRYPNLATSMQSLRNMGRRVNRGQLYSMLKRFGPEILISGGILTAAAVSELMVAGAGRRRMNPGNVPALRRSMRRLESFHKLCVKSDHLRRPRARARAKSC